MLFNSIEFLLFFPAVTLLYFLLPHRYRLFLLLGASCFFYMVFIPAYILILFVLIVIDYFMAIYLEGAPVERKKFFLMISILATCLALFIFKYINFFMANCEVIARMIGWNYPLPVLQIILPIGLSFHTFQSLAYIIEVYKGEQKAERNFWVYALYVMFYPQLVAGPIERPANLLHQFYTEHRFEYARVTDGLKLMVWGFFKKVVIADTLAVYVNQVYGDPANAQAPALILATLFFAFQIYCDFSGYSDIAIGAAQVMGFRLMDNFKRPYFSKSISEFWKRWHISLSTWFRDYLFMPLTGLRLLKQHWYWTMFITFVVSGLWHGANWTYVIWGGLNGFYLLFAIWTSDVRSRLREATGLARHQRLCDFWQKLMTFLLICFSWIFFRASDLHQALEIISRMVSGWQKVPFGRGMVWDLLGLKTTDLLLAIFLIGGLLVIETVQENRGSVRALLASRPDWQRWSFYYMIVLAILFWGKYGRNSFIYFQF